MMMTALYKHQGLADLEDLTVVDGELTSNLEDDEKNFQRWWKDLLPYYKNHVSVLDEKVRAVPLFAGNQLLLLYRQDFFDTFNITAPKTWSELAQTAEQLHRKPLAPDGSEIYSLCLGRISESLCRRRMATTSEDCNSLSMTYLGMTLTTMTQTGGSETGWLFDDNTRSILNLKPLLTPALDRFLTFSELLLDYSAPDELERDATQSMDLFWEGRCAMTISPNHSEDLLNQAMVGFAQMPGDTHILDRTLQELVLCTAEKCPYGTDDKTWGRINRALYGAHDIVVGSVSSLVPTKNQEAVKNFFEFVVNFQSNISTRQQPLN